MLKCNACDDPIESLSNIIGDLTFCNRCFDKFNYKQPELKKTTKVKKNKICTICGILFPI